MTKRELLEALEACPAGDDTVVWVYSDRHLDFYTEAAVYFSNVDKTIHIESSI